MAHSSSAVRTWQRSAPPDSSQRTADRAALAEAAVYRTTRPATTPLCKEFRRSRSASPSVSALRAAPGSSTTAAGGARCGRGQTASRPPHRPRGTHACATRPPRQRHSPQQTGVLAERAAARALPTTSPATTPSPPRRPRSSARTAAGVPPRAWASSTTTAAAARCGRAPMGSVPPSPRPGSRAFDTGLPLPPQCRCRPRARPQRQPPPPQLRQRQRRGPPQCRRRPRPRLRRRPPLGTARA
mmetsp:Transcript_128527/g.399998  ORF Transcript_128527/g.399998 Transcript_128527/m.399998 type:complete len:242 (-) Transcript_128527:1117-1842(-)